jgi:hypothetical protein
MRSPTIEQILLFVLFVLVPLFNLLVRWFKRRAQGRRPDTGPEAPADAAGGRRPLEPADRRPIALPPTIRRGAAAARAVEDASQPPAPTATVPPRAARRRPPPLRIGTARELRRAVVLMAVLGPCRAQETASTGNGRSAERAPRSRPPRDQPIPHGSATPAPLALSGFGPKP